MKNVKTALVSLVVFTVLLGIVYPLAITGIANLFFPGQANGSLIEKDGVVIGSKLVGQEFKDDGFFHSRPSSTGYQQGTASNTALSNPDMKDNVTLAVEEARTSLEMSDDKDVPADLVLESASGLDPDITLEAALAQVKSVAMARNLDEAKLEALVRSLAKQGIGYSYVNVSELNMKMMEMK